MCGHLLLVATTLSDVVPRCMNNSIRICKERTSYGGNRDLLFIYRIRGWFEKFSTQQWKNECIISKLFLFLNIISFKTNAFIPAMLQRHYFVPVVVLRKICKIPLYSCNRPFIRRKTLTSEEEFHMDAYDRCTNLGKRILPILLPSMFEAENFTDHPRMIWNNRKTAVGQKPYLR